MSEKNPLVSELRPSFRLPFLLASMLEKTAKAGLELEQLAYHDELTGALNRRGFKNYLESAKAPKALLVVDDTNLKAVNDILGPDYGDKVIKDTHSLLQASVRQGDVIARWGGDEWVVALNGEVNQASTDYPHGENQRQSLTHTEHVQDAKTRISHVVAGYLVANPGLQHPTINFDLAVGGIEWSGGPDIETLVAQATVQMKAHKDEQHQSGQYR